MFGSKEVDAVMNSQNWHTKMARKKQGLRKHQFFFIRVLSYYFLGSGGLLSDKKLGPRSPWVELISGAAIDL